MTIDSSGCIYVLDNHERVRKLSNDGRLLAKWGARGTGDGEFCWANGITIDKEGTLYICDIGRVQKFSSDGKFIRKWGNANDTSAKTGQFGVTRDIAVDSKGNLYVADWSRIQKFTSEGEFIALFGGFGDAQSNRRGKGQFYELESITLDGTDKIFVADTRNERVQKLSSDGTFLMQWITSARNTNVFGIATDIQGNVYLAEKGACHVSKFSPDGYLLSRWGSEGCGKGEFNNPSGIVVDAKGNVYVADTGNNRIQIFRPKAKIEASDDGKSN
jgi:tripartite motif-containing protein 71